MRADVAVIGAGIIGLAVADEVRLRGRDVICLDPEPGGGQSAGSGRIFRYAHDSPAATRGALGARAAWRRWEDASGRRLIAGNGAAVVGSDATGFAAAMQEVGAAHHWHSDAGGLEQVLPTAMLGGGPGLFDPAGGTIDAEGTIEMLIANLGDRLIRQAALHVDVKSDRAIIHTTGGSVEAAKIVVAAGVATATLVDSFGIRLARKTFGHSRFTLRWSSPLEHPMACFLDRRRDTPAGWSFYGVPLSPELIAVGGGWTELPFPMDRYRVDEIREISWNAVSAWAQQHAPSLELQELDRVDCSYPRVAIEDGYPYLLDQRGPILAVTGNDLFKFAPLVAFEVCDRLHISLGVGA